MQVLKAEKLRGVEINWVKGGESVPMMQGMALNKLNKEYPAKGKRQGWMLWNNPINSDEVLKEQMPEACYYLIERKTKLENEKEPMNCLIAFKENGDNIEGWAIFRNSDYLFALLEADEIQPEDLEATADFYDKITNLN